MCAPKETRPASPPASRPGGGPAGPHGAAMPSFAPPLSLPARHFALATLSLLVFSAALLWGADRLCGFGFQGAFALGLVHVLTLGFILQAILGTWTQMIPVHSGVPLLCTRLARVSWWLLVAGAALFIGLLWAGSDRYFIGAAAAFAAVLMFVVNLGVTHFRAPKHDWTDRHFSFSFGWLAALGLVGLLMAVDRHRGTVFHSPEGGLIAHVHMALVGFVGTTIFGAGYRLFPAVGTYRLSSPGPARLSFALLQLGAAGLALDALFFGRRLMPLWAAMLAGAYLAYFWQMRAALRERPDAPQSFVFLAALGGLLWCALGVGLATGWIVDDTGPRAAYVYSALVGFIMPVVIGQIHRIFPFMAWRALYARRMAAGLGPPPPADQLAPRSLAWLELELLAAAIPLGAAGLFRESPALVRAAGGCLSACALLFLASNLSVARRLRA